MKKLFFLSALFVLCLQFNGFSQKSRVGITGGISLSNQYGTIGTKRVKDDSNVGYTAGLYVNTPLGKSHISFQPGVFYTQKGRTQLVSFKEKTYFHLRYADFQFNFLYNTNGKKGNYYIGAGPSVSFQLPSYAQTIVKSFGLYGEDWGKLGTRSVNFGDASNSDFKGIDYGVNFMTGYALPNGLAFGFNYNVGLRNIVPIPVGTDKLNNHYAAFRVSYLVKNK
jgi:hypothetical protein